MTPLRFALDGRDLPDNRALVLAQVEPTAAAVDAALAEGADLIDLGTADPAFVAETRARHPGVALAATPGDVYALCEAGADLLDGTGGDGEIDETAAQYGRGLITASVRQAEWSQWLQVPRAGVLLDCPPGPDLLRRLDEPVQWPRLITLPDNGLGDAALAVAALAAWRGVQVVRTREVPRVRQALEMAASINGSRPPAAVLRALT
ncbi:hypothetical protein M8C13_14560 [Crossiella sp. SN42]|uniref:hypothetical protein n=1 Tax=Crossiella sp. SN42 TaxID=2944808 RepID=UPI00207CA48D|nr:hypothetical protein [Crossiella sp. SN42]MCO1576977.1 hypothetical protein [Crossiella sp. SN42]